MIYEFLSYVINAPGFYPAIGMTVASGMFVGSTIYGGELPLLKKGMWTIGFYSTFLFIINSMRVVDTLMDADMTHAEIRLCQAWASTNTLVFVTIAYIIGMIMGVFITKRAHCK